MANEEHKKRRDRLYIIADILNIAGEGTVKTRIMYGANLSFSQFNEYLNYCKETNLIEDITVGGTTIWKTTNKGYDFLRYHGRIRNLLKSKRNPEGLPYIPNQ